MDGSDEDVSGSDEENSVHGEEPVRDLPPLLDDEEEMAELTRKVLRSKPFTEPDSMARDARSFANE